MVIDKSIFFQSNESLSIPLLDHKIKDSFLELKKEFQLLQKINNKFKKCSLKNKNITNKTLSSTDTMAIFDYIDKINSILFSIHEKIAENINSKLYINDSSSKETKNLIEKILSESNIFINNIKEIEEKDMQLKSKLNLKQIKIIVNKINEIFKKNENDGTIINIQEENRYNFNRYIDHGHLNIITHRREYNNSTTILGNNFQYSIENENLNYQTKINLFFIIALFLLFICYTFL